MDGDYSALVTITNTSDQAARYRASINYTGGKYNFNIRDIAAGETVIFDLKKIRDEQIQDKDGNTIPLTVTAGQFRWSLIGGDSVRLIGRNEEISLSQGISSSFSCPVCCPDSFSFLDISPSFSSGPAGGTALLAVDGFLLDCYHTTLGPYDWSVSQWWIEDTNVLSLTMVSTGTAQMSCLVAGESDFFGTTTEVYYNNDGMDCYQNVSDFNSGGGTGQVNPVVTVTGASFNFNPIAVNNGTSTLTVNVSASTGVPSGTTVQVEVFQFTNPNGVGVTLMPQNGTQTITLTGAGTDNTTFTVTSNANNTINGQIVYRARILQITSGNPQTVPTIDIGMPNMVNTMPLCVGTCP